MWTWQCDRVVKVMDSKSIGLCPRGFKSLRCRFIATNKSTIESSNMRIHTWACSLWLLQPMKQQIRLTLLNISMKACKGIFFLFHSVSPENWRSWVQSPARAFIHPLEFSILAQQAKGRTIQPHDKHQNCNRHERNVCKHLMRKTVGFCWACHNECFLILGCHAWVWFYLKGCGV